MKIIFLGTPEIAKVCLEKILCSHHKVLAVVTKPDKPSGRGKKIKVSPVKEFALLKKIPVFQFENINRDGIEILKKFKPDVLVLAAFGQILKNEILEIAFPINMHPSLLPKYRGPSPIQSAILNGEIESGVSIIKMAQGVDDGDILMQKKLTISTDDTAETLFKKLGILGGEMLVKCLDLIEEKKIILTPQNHKKSTFTSIISKQDARLNFFDKTENIINKIRAFNPSPVAFFELDKTKYKVFKAKKIEFQNQPKTINLNKNKSKTIAKKSDNNCLSEKELKTKNLKNTFKVGEIVASSFSDGLIIKTIDGFIEILEIQFPGSAKMPIKNFLNGRSLEVGKVINQD